MRDMKVSPSKLEVTQYFIPARARTWKRMGASVSYVATRGFSCSDAAAIAPTTPQPAAYFRICVTPCARTYDSSYLTVSSRHPGATQNWATGGRSSIVRGRPSTPSTRARDSTTTRDISLIGRRGATYKGAAHAT